MQDQKPLNISETSLRCFVSRTTYIVSLYVTVCTIKQKTKNYVTPPYHTVNPIRNKKWDTTERETVPNGAVTPKRTGTGNRKMNDEDPMV